MAKHLRVIMNIFGAMLFFVAFENGRIVVSMRATLTIPRYVDIGDTVKIRSDYKINSHSVRVVRWLHDDVEIYRISHQLRMNRLIEKRTMSTIDAIHIDPINSNDAQMVLVAVQPLLSGNYRHEVRYDNGSMQYAEGELLVAEYSKIPPNLKAQFSNDSVSATCVSDATLPGSNISWMVNNQTIYTAIQYVEREDGKFYTLSVLNGSRALLGRVPRIRIQCTAYIGDLWRASSVILDEARESEKMRVTITPTVTLNNKSAYIGIKNGFFFVMVILFYTIR